MSSEQQEQQFNQKDFEKRIDEDEIKLSFNKLLLESVDGKQQQFKDGFRTQDGSASSNSGISPVSTNTLNFKDQIWWENNLDQFNRTLIYDPRIHHDQRQMIRLESELKSSQYVAIVFLRRFGCPVCRAVTTGFLYLYRHVLYPYLKDQFKLIAIACEDIGYEDFVKMGYLNIYPQSLKNTLNSTSQQNLDPLANSSTITTNPFDSIPLQSLSNGSLDNLFTKSQIDIDMVKNQVQLYVNPSGSAFSLLQLKQLSISNAYGLTDLKRMRAAVNLASDKYFRETSNFVGNYVQLGGVFVFRNDENCQDPECIFEYKEQYAGDTPLVEDLLKLFNIDLTAMSNLNIADQFQDDNMKKLRVLHLAQRAALEIKLLQKQQQQ